MEFSVGETVFLKERSGIFAVLDFDPENNCYLLQSADKVEAPFKAHRDSFIKLSEDITERLRTEALAYETAQAAKAEEPKPASRYDADQILIARTRERVIKPLCELDKITKADKALAKEQLGIGDTVLNDLIARYRKWASWESLVPGKPGRRKGQTQFSEKDEALMARLAAEVPLGTSGNLQAVVNSTLAEFGEDNKNRPSAATIRRRYKQNVSEREALAREKGSKAARDKFDTFTHGTVTTHALQLIHADNSPLDCHARDTDTGKWLGRPNLTIIVDDHTRSFLGFALSFGAPSRNTLADAMLMAIQPKDELMKHFGLSGKFFWMQYGAGENYRVDGGGDLNAKTVLAGLDRNNIIPQRRIRPQSGGKVERGIGKINPLFMQRLRGAIASNRKMARGENPQAMATFTIRDLFILIITQICIWHEFSGDDRLTPNQLWRNSFGVHDGVIKVPRVLPDPQHFWIDMLHERHIDVRREGILTTELLYDAGPYTNQVGKSVRLKIDHNNIHHAWVEHKGSWHEVELINKNSDRIPRTMWEWDIRRKFGQGKSQLTILGLAFVHAQDKLMKGLLTVRTQRRLDESRMLQEEALNSLFPGLIKPFNAPAPAASSFSSDRLMINRLNQVNKINTPTARSGPEKRGSAPPMMGDDDL